MKFRFSYFGLFLLLIACQKEESSLPAEEVLLSQEFPSYFPEIEYPADNPINENSVDLGKKLFYDTRLSVDNSISCASCHKQEFAFADNRSVSTGVEDRLGERNAPSLANVAYHPYLMREGGVPNLEQQVSVPVQEHVEFDFNMVQLVERLKEDEEYAELSRGAFDREFDAFALTRALASFQRTLISGQSKYDLHLQNPDRGVLSSEEQTGMDLFFSDRLNCNSCHGGFNFTDYRFANNGFKEEYSDVGRYRLTLLDEDKHMFKTPSLRNVALTAPYMHDGSVATLEEVIETYNKGGSGHYQQDAMISELNLSDEEQESLLAFLLTLTDNEFIQNEKFSE